MDGEVFGDRYLLAVINNIHLYAGGYAHLSPNALLDDGFSQTEVSKIMGGNWQKLLVEVLG